MTFGDNHNDIPMLEAADRCYTVPEAPEEVKAIVNGILNDDPDCVLKFLLKEVNQQA